MEQGPTFRISLPKYPAKDPHYRIVAHQRSRFTHYYFYVRDEVLGPMVCAGGFDAERWGTIGGRNRTTKSNASEGPMKLRQILPGSEFRTAAGPTAKPPIVRISPADILTIDGAAQTIEAQPASGQIKPKEDAAVRARHDRGVGDGWLAVGPRPHGQIAPGVCRRRLKMRLDRSLAPDAALIMCSSKAAAEESARLEEARTRTANAGENHRREPSKPRSTANLADDAKTARLTANIEPLRTQPAA